MKLSHLGTPGATLPLRLPPGPGRMEDGMHGQPGLLLPGHLKLALKGGKESMGSTQRPLPSGDPAAEDKGPGLFLREGAGKIYRTSRAWPWQELNGAHRDSRQQGKGQGCRERAPLERVPAAGQSVLAGKWQKAILS